MNKPPTGKPREGKSCPRCRTMTFRDREVCEHCGHRFRTGLGTGLSAAPVDAPLLDEAALNRTMQFTLPPLPPRKTEAAPQPKAARMPYQPRQLGASAFALAASALGLAIVCAWGYFHYARSAQAARPSPVGVWETTLTGHAAQDAHLRFVFAKNGSGTLSWDSGGRPPYSSESPLHWRLDADGKIVLTIPPPDVTAEPSSGKLVTGFSSHPWLWHVDRAQHRLVLGTLNFTEKR